jgi:hypothetical protein
VSATAPADLVDLLHAELEARRQEIESDLGDADSSEIVFYVNRPVNSVTLFTRVTRTYRKAQSKTTPRS